MFTIKPVPETLKMKVLQWRNNEIVRKSMITQDPISEANHLAWWERLSSDQGKRLLLVEDSRGAVGIVTFFGIEQKSGWWGFYPAEDADGNIRADIVGWIALEQAALSYAFDVIGLDTLLCETRHDNLSVLGLHDRMGFTTLPPDDYPNALAHNLIVKKIERADFDTLRREGQLLAKDELKTERHPMDEAQAEVEIPSVRFAILGSANWAIAAQTLGSHFGDFTGLCADVYLPPFGQSTLELLDPESILRATRRDFVVFAERYEDFCDPFAVPGQTDETLIQQKFDRYLATIRMARSEIEGTFIIHDFRPVRGRFRSIEERIEESDAASQLCRAFNKAISQLCSELSDCIRLPVADLIAECGVNRADPGRFWLLGRMAYGADLIEEWAKLLTGVYMSLSGKTARALVLDLDNTMWGGVIGDDGMAGISLGSDYPGNEFKTFQNTLLAIKSRGLPLTVASKNTEEVALEAIRDHPEMMIREKDIIAHRINWMPKSQNIRELASDLSLGLGSLMFIDDNPVERAEVRRNAPGVIVPEMPEDVTLWPEFLLSHPSLTAIALSDEDLKRARSYEIRKQIQSAEQAAPSREAFLADLGMSLEVASANDGTLRRVMQLIAKTNQFNTTSKRYSAADIDALVNAGGEVLALRLKDRFGSDELIGVVVVDYGSEKATIDNFIMSCRVLGRGVESAALAVVSERAVKRGIYNLTGVIIPTDRNQPCRSLYSNAGFADNGDTTFTMALENGPLLRPSWMDIVTN